MKKLFLFALCSIFAASVQAQELEFGSCETKKLKENFSLLNINTAYLDNTYQGMGWHSNWFASIDAGTSAFIGSPSGHGDLFDRFTPGLGLSVGKWVTPTVGFRLKYEGFKLKDTNLDKIRYNNLHADFMYNLSYLFYSDYQSAPKWNFIPYVGLGVLHNGDNGFRTFALSYGVNIGYKISDRLMAHAELGTSATWSNFDSKGSNHSLNDNLAHLSFGLSYTIGKTGWQRVIDAKPYIAKSDYLENRLVLYSQENERLMAQHSEDQETIKQYLAILKMERLLDKYGIVGDESICIPSKNDYSGLNSLRRRLRQKNLADAKENYLPAYYNPSDTTKMSTDEYVEKIKEGSMFVGTPIFFFFKKGTTIITENSQILNIREVANVMKKYQLHARIIGAADKMTGTVKINKRLGDSRSKHLAKLLQKEGVSQENIKTEGRGGIDDYMPPTANRNACILLYTK